MINLKLQILRSSILFLKLNDAFLSIFLKENCEDDCLFMFNGDCGKNSSTFQFLSDGFVRESITRKCLEIKKESNGNNTALHLVKNCSETSKWDFIDFPITSES